MMVDIKEIIPIDKRWEEGIEHDPRSIEVYEFISEYDFEHCGDSFCFKSGGDGDNGETLMYLLDEYFACKDLIEKAP